MTERLANLPANQADIERVDLLLRERLDTGDPYLTGIATHLVDAGGKKLRPLIALTAAKLFHPGPAAPQDAVKAAAACELVHIGSLYHDDVMDESPQRRGVATVNATWGNLQAIVAGDFLLAKASEIAAELGAESARILAETIGRLCQGQISEVRTGYDTNRTVRDYLASIDGKTSSLFEAAARLGALAGGAGQEQAAAAAEAARAFGTVFQIVDDVLDLTADRGAIGKPVGHDIREGVYTLPVLLVLERPGPVADKLRALLREQGDARAAAQLVIKADGITRALEIADTHAELAERLGTGNHPARQALAGAARELLEHTRRTLDGHVGECGDRHESTP